ncbi:MAG: NAD(P)/FAD-dependent oxidoreductase [Acidimicrobiia bacterium]|nr:NAD(P)/FAD-dependent oxidoreductase [Acidimicrobiia bacterium]
MGGVREVDAVVVGAGFAGLYMLHRLRAGGWSAQGFEAGGGVGGTWYWNRYPGARCDVESVEYSYKFDEDLQQEWEWAERYASQPEILRYLEHVADRFDLRRDIQFDTRVESAHVDERANRWVVRTDDGATTSARFVIMATGCLSAANLPSLPGLDRFAGDVLHTGQWPHEQVDFTGRRVGVVGTGSSGIQSIPVIAEQAEALVVFQRTPNYSVPARNRRLDPDEVAAVKAGYAELREANQLMPTGFGSRTPMPVKPALEADEDERRREFEARWERGGFGFLAAFLDLTLDRAANDTAAEFVRDKIRATVKDPLLADRLAPTQVIGCKRLCIDTGYFETYNQAHVRLVDINVSPIVEVTGTGVRTSEGDISLDCLVFATGFDAMTGALLRMDIRGVGGQPLQEAWAAGPRTYLGLGVPGFPNLFVITGPGSPSVLTNMVVSIEHHVEWITDLLEHVRTTGVDRIEATSDAADEWVAYVNAIAGMTLFPTCNSWYLGANVPGKPRIFMPLPGFPPYVEHCAHVAANGYKGFALTASTG